MHPDLRAAEKVSLKLIFLAAGGGSISRLMSDCEEGDFLCESWTPRVKRKKEPQADRKSSKFKDIITMKTQKSIKKKKKKKKKSSKLKEAIEGGKEKKKERKKKILGFDDSFSFKDSYSGAFDPVAKFQSESSNPSSTGQRTQNSKKKVAFDLPLRPVQAKRPKFIPSSSKENTLPQKEAVTDTASCSKVTVTGYSQSQPLDNDSQFTCSDDINSQDLFITQNTFRTLPTEPSSDDASDKADDNILQSITQQEMAGLSSVVQIHHREESSTHLHGSHFHQHPRQVKGHVLKPKGVEIVLSKRKDHNFHVAKPNVKKQLNTNLTKGTTVSVESRGANLYLDDSEMFNSYMGVAKPKQILCTLNQQPPTCLLNTNGPSLLPWMSTRSVSTQTENFFTTKLSSYLHFYQKHKVPVCNLKPLDLSLPQRIRKDLDKNLGVKMPKNGVGEEKLCEQKQSLADKIKGHVCKDPNLPSSRPSYTKIGMKKTPAVRQLWSWTAKDKSEATLNPQSDPEPKSEDTTSSEDNEPSCRTGKVDLTQVRAVQMRLNESFFFKTKGEGQSPRPEYPLMKLVQSTDMKSKKGC